MRRPAIVAGLVLLVVGVCGQLDRSQGPEGSVHRHRRHQRGRPHALLPGRLHRRSRERGRHAPRTSQDHGHTRRGESYALDAERRKRRVAAKFFMTMGALKLDNHKPTDDVVAELDAKLRPAEDHPDVIAFFETDTRNDADALWSKLKVTIEVGADYDCYPVPYVQVGTSQRLVALLVCVRVRQAATGDQDEPRLELRAALDQTAPQVTCPAGSDSAKAVISRTVLLNLLEADTDESRPVHLQMRILSFVP